MTSNSVFMSERLIFNEPGICAFFKFLVSSSFLVSNKLQVFIFQISLKVQKGILMIFSFFWNLSVHRNSEEQQEVGNGRKLENQKMEGNRNCVFRDDVCVLNLSVHLWLHLLFCFGRLSLLGCPSLSRFCFLYACCRRAGVLRWFLSVVGSPTLSGSAHALPPPAEKLRDVLLPSLPLTKKTLLK